jgi:FemAB-related protein (PEP-CTERM system-associated)
MTVKLCLPVDEPAWDAYVDTHPRALGYHRIAWRRIIDQTFGHTSYYLMAEAAGRVTGVLPAVRLRSPLFGDFLVSLPFVNYGGPCADDDGVVRTLMGALADLGRELGVDHVEVRTETDTDYGLRARSAKVSMRKRLPRTAEELSKSFPAKLRSQIKRAQQEAMTVRIGREEELDAFYEVFSINMRDLGTPVYSRRLFSSVLSHLPESSWICTVWLGATPVAAGFLVGFRDTLEIPWASSLRRFNRLSPNMPAAALAGITIHLREHHLTPAQVGELARGAGVKSIVVTHLSAPAFDEKRAAEYMRDIGRAFSGPVAIARDLETY